MWMAKSKPPYPLHTPPQRGLGSTTSSSYPFKPASTSHLYWLRAMIAATGALPWGGAREEPILSSPSVRCHLPTYTGYAQHHTPVSPSLSLFWLRATILDGKRFFKADCHTPSRDAEGSDCAQREFAMTDEWANRHTFPTYNGYAH